MNKILIWDEKCQSVTREGYLVESNFGFMFELLFFILKKI